jgi:hypothetical protein
VLIRRLIGSLGPSKIAIAIAQPWSWHKGASNPPQSVDRLSHLVLEAVSCKWVNGKRVYLLTVFSVGANNYGKITIGANAKVTSGDIFGNTGNGQRTPNETVRGSGHWYRDITVGRDSIVHMGTTGVGTARGHHYVETNIGDGSKLILGDFESLEIRKRVFTLPGH